MLVHAAGTYSHPESGDQTGNEICIQNYYDAGWQYCLRFPEKQEGSSGSTNQASQSSLSSDPCCRRPVDPKSEDFDRPALEASEDVPAPVSFDPVTVTLPVLKNGDKGPSVMALQCLLNGYGWSVGPCGIDGEFGPDTEKALRTFQSVLAISEDGKTGERTWNKLLKGE